MTTELETVQMDSGTLAVKELVNDVARIQMVMDAVMKREVHYGIIPGTQKPMLYKAGAEKLLTAFKLGALPSEETITDLSARGEIRYRVMCPVVHLPSGRIVGHGLGECSSAEEKFKWREAVCPEEWEETDPEERRVKFKKGRWDKAKRAYGPFQRVQQVRIRPDDVANTVLKMAKKRALVDGTLTVTCASDCFEQDLEDYPVELRTAIIQDRPEKEEARPKEPEVVKPQSWSAVMPAYIAKHKGKALDDPSIPLSTLQNTAKGIKNKHYTDETMRFKENDQKLVKAMEIEISRRQKREAQAPEDTEVEPGVHPRTVETVIIENVQYLEGHSDYAVSLLADIRKNFSITHEKELAPEHHDLYLEQLSDAVEVVKA